MSEWYVYKGCPAENVGKSSTIDRLKKKPENISYAGKL